MLLGLWSAKVLSGPNVLADGSSNNIGTSHGFGTLECESAEMSQCFFRFRKPKPRKVPIKPIKPMFQSVWGGQAQRHQNISFIGTLQGFRLLSPRNIGTSGRMLLLLGLCGRTRSRGFGTLRRARMTSRTVLRSVPDQEHTKRVGTRGGHPMYLYILSA